MQIFAIKDYLLCTTRAKLSIDFTFFYEVGVMHANILYSTACFVTVTHIHDVIHTFKMCKALYRYRSKQMMRKSTKTKPFC